MARATSNTAFVIIQLGTHESFATLQHYLNQPENLCTYGGIVWVMLLQLPKTNTRLINLNMLLHILASYFPLEHVCGVC